MATYEPIKPEDVTAPKDYWTLGRVLYNSGPGGWAAAEGTWDEEPRLALRWNGDKNRPRGNPISNNHPTWFMVPKELEIALRLALVLLGRP